MIRARKVAIEGEMLLDHARAEGGGCYSRDESFGVVAQADGTTKSLCERGQFSQMHVFWRRRVARRAME